MKKSKLMAASLPCLSLVFTAFLYASRAAADDAHFEAISAFLQQKVSHWVEDPLVQRAIREQNQNSSIYSQSQIDMLDNDWKREIKVGSGKLVSTVIDSDASAFLRKRMVESDGLITEIFIMDARGLNVAAAEATSDYWQGDEDKWKNTFAKGTDAIFVDKVKYDESSDRPQVQVSMTIVDPQTQAPIGAITLGVNMSKLK